MKFKQLRIPKTVDQPCFISHVNRNVEAQCPRMSRNMSKLLLGMCGNKIRCRSWLSLGMVCSLASAVVAILGTLCAMSYLEFGNRLIKTCQHDRQNSYRKPPIKETRYLIHVSYKWVKCLYPQSFRRSMLYFA